MENLRSAYSEVFLGNDCLQLLRDLLKEKYSSSSIFILTDSNCEKFCLKILEQYLGETFNYKLIVIPHGEENKNLQSCEIVWSVMTDASASRNSLLISLGGGMIGDLGGFAASTYQRGIDHILIPTSLLAMVDASTGGKTGINYAGLKNQVGTFSHPRHVFIFPDFLKTLPERDYNSGLAEIIKHALIADESLWRSLQLFSKNRISDIVPIVSHSIEIKNSFVDRDERDFNQRHALNFGHSIGHAMEAYSLSQHAEPFRHGEAVALGMIAEAYLSHHMTGLSHDAIMEISGFIAERFNYLNPELEPQQLMKFILADKKNIQSIPNFSLLPAIGSVSINQTATIELITKAIEYSLRHFMVSKHD